MIAPFATVDGSEQQTHGWKAEKKNVSEETVGNIY